jgi:methylornithine synthase
MRAKFEAHSQGLLIEEGVLCGVGERYKDLVHSLMAMQTLRVDQIRAMTFIPQQGTPMAARFSVGAYREILLIAMMRLMFPEALIPASLDVDGIHGLKQRLDAGANVVTSIVPPGSGLAGVARPSLDIEEGKRTVSKVDKVLNACRLQAATLKEYEDWIDKRKQFNENNYP